MKNSEKSGLFVNVSVASIHAKAEFASEVVTQALLGEELEVLEINSEWLKIRQWDGYEGWLNQFFGARVSEEYLAGVKSDQAMIVGDLFGDVYEEADRTMPVVRDLVYGDRLVSLEDKNGWRQVLLPDGESGWTDSGPQRDFSVHLRETLVKEARRFLGIQYLWGGKSPKGFDCSGFVQTVMKQRIPLPRDTHLQVDHPGLEDIGPEEVEKGDLIFFGTNGRSVDHVAISLGGDEFIHCSGFVKIDTLDVDSARSSDRSKRRIVVVKSIERYCN
ncbi:MAG: C40 family peptidase [Candidatus Neomarinimicrobiota bacterium]